MAVSMEHDEARRLLASYLAGGLEGAELSALEAHLAGCEVCARELRELTQLDQEMDMIFAEARPEANLEDRIVRGLWTSGQSLKFPSMRVHPAVWKVAMGVAATIVLGTVGYIGNDLITGNRLPLMGGAVNKHVAVHDVNDLLGSKPQFAESPDFDMGQATTRPSSSGNLAGIDGKDYKKWSKTRVASPDENGRGQVDAMLDRFDSSRGRKGGQFGDHSYALRGSEVSGARGGGGGQEWGASVGQQGQSTDPSTWVTVFGKFNHADLTKNLDGAARPDIDADTAGSAGRKADDSFDSLATRAPMSGPQSGYANLEDFVTFQKSAGGAVAAGGDLSAPVAGKELGGFRAVETPPAALPTPYYFQPAGYGVEAGTPEAAQKSSGLLGVEFAEKRTGLSRSGSQARAPQNQAAGGLMAGAIADGTAPQNEQPAESNAPKTGGGNSSANAQNPQTKPPVENPAATQFARKIIRNGEMEFEVDSFDSTFVTISRVVVEEGGFVSSTNSEKLPNGKVRGTVVVRVPPDRLDVLVLKLRALGDIKSQRISAQDVTKVYYDLESELRAARAMEERLLNIIKSGKGEIKDLLEAEKQLGVYRERIEKLEGEVRYYNNLVSLSTLSITASERDIRQAAMTAQSETVSMGMESEDVEKSRADALKAIEDAKGRIIESNLKKYDAGQVAATVVAEVSPDAAGPLIDRLRQLGKVARLDIDRKQTTAEGRPPVPGARVEKKDTRFAISIYNLANIAPRQTTNLNLAVPNVEDAYRAILATVTERKGRVVTSNLARQKGGEQTTASIQFEVPAAEADAVLAAIRLEREVMALTVAENPDTQNVTTAKRGFAVQVYSLATVPPRETEQLVLAARGRVGDAFRNLLAEARKADARVLVSQLNEQDASNLGASLDIEVLRGKEVDLRQALLNAGDIVSRNVNRSSDTDNTVDSKVRLQIRLIGLEKLAPRETQSLSVAAYDVPAAYSALAAALAESGARVISSQLNEQDRRNITATLDFEVLRASREKVDKALADAGVVYARSVTRSPDTQNTVDNKVRLQVVLASVSQLPPREVAQLSVVVRDVAAAERQVETTAAAVGGRIVDSRHATDSNGRVTSHTVVDVPLAKAGEVRAAIEQLGEVRVKESTTNPATPDGQVARARFEVTLANAETIVGRDEGLGAALRNALATSVKGLLWSLQFIVIGLLFVGPWALLIWALWRFFKRPRPALVTAGATPAA